MGEDELIELLEMMTSLIFYNVTITYNLGRVWADHYGLYFRQRRSYE